MGFGLNGIWSTALLSHLVAAAAAYMLGNFEWTRMESFI